MRQYLQEIGYTDTIIDVRSNRVRSLLGLTTNTSLEEPQTGGQESSDTAIRKPNDSDAPKYSYISTPRNLKLDTDAWKPAQTMVTDAEASVLATFEFLNEQREARNQEDVDEDEDEEEGCEEIDTNRSAGPYSIDTETEEVLAEFDFLSTHPNAGEQKDSGPWGRPGITSYHLFDFSIYLIFLIHFFVFVFSNIKVRLKMWSISESWLP